MVSGIDGVLDLLGRPGVVQRPLRGLEYRNDAAARAAAGHRERVAADAFGEVGDLLGEGLAQIQLRDEDVTRAGEQLEAAEVVVATELGGAAAVLRQRPSVDAL